MVTTPSQLTLSVEEAGRRLGIGRDLAYQQARQGHIGPVPVYRIGRRLVVPAAAVERVLAGEAIPTPPRAA